MKSSSTVPARRDEPCRASARLALVPVLFSLSMALLMPASGYAQTDERRMAGVPIGEADAFPAIRLDYRRDDNVFVTPENETVGVAIVVSPSVEVVADRRLLRLSAAYAGRYSQGSDEAGDALDTADHRLGVRADATLDKRKRLFGFVDYARESAELGSDLTIDRAEELGEPVVSDVFGLGGRFRYGVVDARGNLEFGASVATRAYANLPEVTDGRDFTTASASGLFSYRLSGDTRALAEVRYADVSVDDRINSRGELSLFGGLEFVATGRLSGSARVGITDVAYDRPVRDDVTLLAVEIAVDYRPVSYATLSLTADRELDDRTARSGGESADQAISDTVGLAWSHRWTSRIAHVAALERAHTSRDCPGSDVTILSAGYELGYDLRRWLSFGASAELSVREDDRCEGSDDVEDRDFERSVLGVYVRATL